jgi:hypothetical protein
MITALLGFAAPFLPDVMGLFKGWMDHKQELESMKLRHEMAKDEFGWRIEEIHTKADIEEMKAIRKPHASYGVQMLDKVAGSGLEGSWIFKILLCVYTFLDFLISSVRPGITYWAFGLYTLSKMATLNHISSSVKEFMPELSKLDHFSQVMENQGAFTTFDQDMLILIIAFWFGQRSRSRAIGSK